MKLKYSDDLVIGKENDGTPITLKEYQRALLDMLGDVIQALEKDNIEFYIDSGTLLGAVRHGTIIPWDDDIDLMFKKDDYKKVVNALTNNLNADSYAVQCFDTDPSYDITQAMKVRKKHTYVKGYDKSYVRSNCKENGIFIDLFAASDIPESKWMNKIYRLTSTLRIMLLVLLNKFGFTAKWLKRYHLRASDKFHEKAKGSPLIGYEITYFPWLNLVMRKDMIFPLTKKKFDRYMISVPRKTDDYLKIIYGDYMQIPNLDEIELLHSTDLKLKSGYVKKD